MALEREGGHRPGAGRVTMENPEKQGVGRGPRGEGKGHALGREGGRRRNRRQSSPAPWPGPGALQPGLGAEKPSAPSCPSSLPPVRAAA